MIAYIIVMSEEDNNYVYTLKVLFREELYTLNIPEINDDYNL